MFQGKENEQFRLVELNTQSKGKLFQAKENIRICIQRIYWNNMYYNL